MVSFQSFRNFYNVKADNCLKIRQFFILFLTLFSTSILAFVPDDDLSPVPNEHNIWVDTVIVPDDAGVMNSIKNTYTSWIELEEYIDNWNLRSTNIYSLPDSYQKKSYTGKMFLKYLDKRLSGEVRKSKEGSTLYAIGQAQKALKPQSEVRLAPSLKIKLKARVIQRRIIVLVKNPFMDTQMTINHRGEALFTLTRNIEPLKVFTSINYEHWNQKWVVALDRKLTEKISSRLSSHQNDETMAFVKKADTRLEFFFNHYF